MIDKNLNWQSHINLVESKISKNIGVLIKGSLHLIRHAYQHVSHLFIYKYVSYIGYGNTAWASASQNKHKKNTKRKHVVSIIFHEEKEAYARLCQNVYQIISYKFVHLSTFEEIEHKYLTRFSEYNFRQPPAFVNYDNTQYLLCDRNYGIQFYQRLKSKENFFLITMR